MPFQPIKKAWNNFATYPEFLARRRLQHQMALEATKLARQLRKQGRVILTNVEGKHAKLSESALKSTQWFWESIDASHAASYIYALSSLVLADAVCSPHSLPMRVAGRV